MRAAEGKDPPVRVIAANMLAQFGGQLLNTVLAAFVSIVVVRHLGRAEYGVMAFVVSYLSYFLILTSVGVDIVLMRDVARAPGQAATLLERAVGLRLALSSATILLSWAVAPFAAPDSRIVGLAMLYSLTLAFSVQGVYHVAFQAQFRGPTLQGTLAVWALAFTAVRLGLVLAGGRVVHFLAADVLSAAVGLAVSRHIARRHLLLDPRPRLDWPAWGRLLAQGWPLALASWLIALHARIDQTILFRMRGADALGGYSVAVRLSEVWILLANVFMASTFPLLARHSSDSGERLERTATLAYRYLYAVIVPIALGLALYAGPILRVLFGTEFVDAAVPLMLLAGAEVFAFSNAVTYNVLFSSGLQRTACLVAFGSLALNAALNVVLIPAWSAAGAAAASLLSYGSVTLLALAFRPTRRLAFRAVTELLRPALVALALGATIGFLGLGPLPGAGAIALVYPAGLLLAGGLGRQDLDLLKRVLRRD